MSSSQKEQNIVLFDSGTDLKDLKKCYVMRLEKSKNYLCYQPQYKGVEVIQQVLNDYHANEETMEVMS